MDDRIVDRTIGHLMDGGPMDDIEAALKRLDIALMLPATQSSWPKLQELNATQALSTRKTS